MGVQIHLLQIMILLQQLMMEAVFTVQHLMLI